MIPGIRAGGGGSGNTNANASAADLESLNENKNEFKKKKRVLYPNIRFNLEIDTQPVDGNITEYNFNSIMLKALKFKQKLITENITDPDALKRVPIIERDFIVDSERLPDLINRFERKISLTRGQSYIDADDDESEDEGEDATGSLDDDDDDGSEDGGGRGEGEENIENSDEDEDDDDEDEEDDESGDDDDEDDIDDEEDASSNSGGGGARIKSENFARWAKGYDDEDSFIDNTEAMEERLPSNKMPKHGKFYVNKDQKIQLVKTKPNAKKSDDEDSNIVVKKASRKLSSSTEDNSIEEIPVKKMKRSDDLDKSTQQAVKKPPTVATTSKIQSSSSSSSPILITNNNTATEQQKQQVAAKTSTDTNEDRVSPATYSKISQNLKDLLKKIENELARQKTYDGVWSNEIKALFLGIYKECAIIDMHDKSEIFRYLAFKLSIKKTSLLKRCKRLSEKDQSDNNQSQTTATTAATTSTTVIPTVKPQQQQQHQHQNNTPNKKQHATADANIIETAKQQYQQQLQLQLQQQQKQQQQQQRVRQKSETIDEDSVLEPDLKEKILYVVQIYNQTNPREFTFEINNYLNSIDSQARKLYNKEIVSKIYDYLAASFKIEKDRFMRKLSQIRQEFIEKQLRNSINKFRTELNKEMKMQEEKHNQAYLEFVKKLNEEQQKNGQQLGEQEKKKIFGPRKKFIWSSELRDLFKTVLLNSLNLFETRENKAQDKQAYLKEFLSREIFSLWPEGWMQIIALNNESELVLGWKTLANKKPPQLNVSSSSSPQQQQQQQQQQQSNNQMSQQMATNRVQSNDKPVNKPQVNSAQAMIQNTQQQQQQPRKIIPEKIQASQQIPQQQRSQTSINQPQQQQRTQNNTQQQHQQSRPQQQQQASSSSPQQQKSQQNVVKQQQQQQQQQQQHKVQNQTQALNNSLAGIQHALTPNQQKLFSNANSLPLNSFLTSYLSDYELQQQLAKQLQTIYSTSTDFLSSTATPNKPSSSQKGYNNHTPNRNNNNNEHI